MKRLATIKELKGRKILYLLAIGHLKLYLKELLRGNSKHKGSEGKMYTHLELAKANFSQWIFPPHYKDRLN